MLANYGKRRVKTEITPIKPSGRGHTFHPGSIINHFDEPRMTSTPIKNACRVREEEQAAKKAKQAEKSGR